MIVAVILLVGDRNAARRRGRHPPKLDIVGVGLSVAGLGLAVFGILMGSAWGFIVPMWPDDQRKGVTPLGFSVVPFLIWRLGHPGRFGSWEDACSAGRDRLLDLALLGSCLFGRALDAVVQQLVLLGTFFILPVYLQVVVGLDAFETGKRLIPMSAAMLIAAVTGPRLAANLSPRRVSQLGLIAVAVGPSSSWRRSTSTSTTSASRSRSPFGVGAGPAASQLGNVIMSSAPTGADERGRRASRGPPRTSVRRSARRSSARSCSSG